MKEIKNELLKYLIELFIVAFGVFLGIIISENKANNQINRNVKNSITYIIDELETNSGNLKKSIKYHEMIKENLSSFRSLKEKDLLAPYFGSQIFHFTKIKGWTGINLPKFENIAFESAKISGIFQEMDIASVQTISRAYKQIAFNEDFGKSLFEKMIAMNSETKTIDAIGMIQLLTTDVLSSEKSLDRELEKILAKIKDEQ